MSLEACFLDGIMLPNLQVRFNMIVASWSHLPQGLPGGDHNIYLKNCHLAITKRSTHEFLSLQPCLTSWLGNSGLSAISHGN